MSEEIRHVVEASGALGPAAFVLVYAGLTALMVPGSLTTVAAGALFGALWGSVLTVAGATLGAIAAFSIARRFGRERVERRLGQRTARLDRWLSGRGFRAMLVLRLLPVVPFNAVNYAAGLSGIRRRDYLLATVVGIVPGTVAFVGLGSSLSDPGSPAFVGSLAVVALLVIVTSVAQRRLAPPAGTARSEGR